MTAPTITVTVADLERWLAEAWEQVQLGPRESPIAIFRKLKREFLRIAEDEAERGGTR